MGHKAAISNMAISIRLSLTLQRRQLTLCLWSGHSHGSLQVQGKADPVTRATEQPGFLNHAGANTLGAVHTRMWNGRWDQRGIHFWAASAKKFPSSPWLRISWVVGGGGEQVQARTTAFSLVMKLWPQCHVELWHRSTLPLWLASPQTWEDTRGSAKKNEKYPLCAE